MLLEHGDGPLKSVSALPRASSRHDKITYTCPFLYVSLSKPIRLSRKFSDQRSQPRTKDQLNRIWYGYQNRRPQHFDSTRYYGVNLHNVWYRGTVEFRWFEGTRHAGEVKAYIQLVLAIAAKGKRGKL